jgi:large subunit ribosomal protein L25
MSDIIKLDGEIRERVGKGSSRAARLADRIPAVIYGDKKDPVSLTLAKNELVRLLNRGSIMTHMFHINVGGTIEKCLPRDLQKHVVSDEPMHVDFLRLAKGATIAIELPVVFTDEEESPAMKRGGVLNVVKHTIECIVPADNIPNAIKISLTGLDIGDSVHISAVDLPEGCAPTITDRDFTIVTVVAPSALKSADSDEDEDEDGEGVEGEEGAEGVEGEEGATEGGEGGKGGKE